MVAAAVLMAVGLIEADGLLDERTVARWPRVLGAGVEGSRALLAAIAGSMITIAGTIFSITVVALSLASSQYTPRILRNFMRDRTNQFVLGFFVGVFAYCLIVLRAIRGADEGRFLPSLAVLVGIALALASIGVLILFIHHIAASIQANTIIANAAGETIAALRKLFPHEVVDEAEQDEEAAPSFGSEAWQAILATRSGYIQSVDNRGLIEFSREHDTVVRMACGVGEFVVDGSPLVWLRTAETRGDEARATALRALYTIGESRTVDQDAAFGIRQLVDIALKALSPGINDTTTAVDCVHYLGAILAVAAAQRIESLACCDGATLRVLVRGTTFEGLTAEACDQIRGSAGGNVAVMLALLRALGTAAQRTRLVSRRRVLRQQVELVAELAERSLTTAYERAQVHAGLAAARADFVVTPTRDFLNTG